MHIERIGFTALKGTRHQARDTAVLEADGPVGDRVFCLVDPERERVLRTVENPTLVRAAATFDAGVLSVDLEDRTLEGTPGPTGEVLKVDYWGRRAAVEVVEGPWADAFSEHLGRRVVLARAAAGEVVYGAAVTVLSTASMRLLADRLGRPVDSARFRSTLLVDAGEEPHVEDGWPGRELRLGDAATILVRSIVPRCAVVDVHPRTGLRDTPVLSTLAGYRRGEREVHFGVDAVVVGAGVVRAGDQVELGRG